MTVHASDNRHGDASERPDPRVALLAELADPLRLKVIDSLSVCGPGTVSELACDAGVALPQLSNHLRRLREAGLVRVQRKGRQAVYSIADPGLEALIPVLDAITGRVATPPEDRASGESRTCYSHLAGPLGVALFRGLMDGGALVARPDGSIELGPRATHVFGALSVETGADPSDRRQFGFECLDATEHATHLAGTMGDRLADALFDRGWVLRVDDARAVRVSTAGARGLRRTLGIEIEANG